MSVITLHNGLTLGTLPKGKVKAVVDQAELLKRLQALRAEWEQATGGDLESVTLNLRLLLEDFESMIRGEG